MWSFCFNRNIKISQPCVNSKNCSVSFLFFYFQPCNFHSTHSQVSIQLKIQGSGSPGLFFLFISFISGLYPPNSLWNLISIFSPTWVCCSLFRFPLSLLQSGNCLQAVAAVIIRKAHVMYSSSLRDNSSALPSVQSLQMVVSDILYILCFSCVYQEAKSIYN